MTSERLARQLYTKEWKRARREVLDVRALVRAQLDGEYAAERAEMSAHKTFFLTKQGGLECSWTNVGVRKKVMALALPNINWAKHAIRKVWYKTDDYELAERKCKAYTNDSCPETDDGTANNKKRVRRPPRNYSSSDDDWAPTQRKQARNVGPCESPVEVHTPLPQRKQARNMGTCEIRAEVHTPPSQRKQARNVDPYESRVEPHFPEPPFYPESQSNVAASPSTHAPSCQMDEDIEEQASFQAVEEITHGEERRSSDIAFLIKHVHREMERAMEQHFGRVTRRLVAIERRIEDLEKKSEATVISNPAQHQPPQQEEVLLGPCTTVEELEDLDRSLAQPDRRNQMKRFLGSLGGANPGAAVRRILRQVATNQVLGEYSLKGRRAKKPFQKLALCKVITEVCMQNFPLMKVADIEGCIGHALKFAPHRRPAPQAGTTH